MNEEILKKSSANIQKSLQRVAKKKFADSPEVCKGFFFIYNLYTGTVKLSGSISCFGGNSTALRFLLYIENSPK